MNECYLLLMYLLDFGLLLLLYRLMGRIGALAWIPIATILANIQVLKTVEIFGLTATLGNMAYASIFLATDILSENYGKKDAQLAVWLGFFASLATVVVMSVAVLFAPHESDFAHESLKTIFTVVPRVAFGSLLAYLASQFNDVHLYHLLKARKPDVKYLWLRNNVATMVSQLLDTVIFTFIAFWGLFPLRDFISILITTYFFKFVAALLDTPCLYLASSWYRNDKIKER